PACRIRRQTRRFLTASQCISVRRDASSFVARVGAVSGGVERLDSVRAAIHEGEKPDLSATKRSFFRSSATSKTERRLVETKSGDRQPEATFAQRLLKPLRRSSRRYRCARLWTAT